MENIISESNKGYIGKDETIQNSEANITQGGYHGSKTKQRLLWEHISLSHPTREIHAVMKIFGCYKISDKRLRIVKRILIQILQLSTGK